MKKEQKTCTFVISKELWNEFDEVCKTEGMTVSEKLRRYIKGIVKEHKNKTKIN